MNASPAKTYALVVGIERYDKAPWPSLYGPAGDACRFVNWLRSPAVGVPAANIALFVSRVPDKPRVDPADAAVVPRDPTSDAIRHEVERIASLEDVDLLMVFWGGHGLGDSEDRRNLLYADATPDAPWCFDMQAFLQALRTDLYEGIKQHVVIVDACATFEERLRFTVEIPTTSFPRGKMPIRRPQFVLYASQMGREAANLNREGTGALSREVLAELQASSFPPPIEDIAARVCARFKELDASGQLRQVPTFLSRTDWSDSQDTPFRRGTAEGAEAQSWLVPKLYDRDAQETDFAEELNDTLSGSDAVASCIVYGKEFEQHSSFVQRVVERRVRTAVSRLNELGRGTCYAPDEIITIDTGVASDMRREIRDKLATAANIDRLPDTGWQLLADGGLLQYRTVVFSHLIQVRALPGAHLETLRWYLDDFWAPPPDASARPKVLVFIMIELADRSTQRSLLRPRSWLSDPSATFARGLESLVQGPGRRQILRELTHLESIDVMNWFLRYAKGRAGLTEDHDCRVAAKQLFEQAELREGEKDIRRTDAIEGLLGKRYRELTATERVHGT